MAGSNQHLPEAQMFYSLPKTNTEAGFNLLLAAAEQDYPEAVAFAIYMYNMQMLNTPGHMEPEEYDKFLHWIEKGANLNIRTAQDFLGRVSAIGYSDVGIERDIAKAYFWYVVLRSAGVTRSPLLEALFGENSTPEDKQRIARMFGGEGSRKTLTAEQMKAWSVWRANGSVSGFKPPIASMMRPPQRS